MGKKDIFGELRRIEMIKIGEKLEGEGNFKVLKDVIDLIGSE